MKIITRLHAKNAADRYRSAAEVADLMGRCLAHVQQPATVPLPAELAERPMRERSVARWAIAACLVMCGFVVLAGTTAVGQQAVDYVATVLRLKTPEGYLVVETDDPNVSIKVDGNDLIVTGGGVKELALPVGQHNIAAIKDGTTLREELVTITRGGRRTLSVRTETEPRTAGAEFTSESYDFLVSPKTAHLELVSPQTAHIGKENIGSALANPPKPARKDTPAALKPKNAVLTASVEPAEAKPGETVAFKVTAKLDPGTYIYHYSTKQGPGPINTTIDFFDTGGLKAAEYRTASREPEKIKDPNFPDVEFVECYHDEVTWSIPVKIPEDAQPGKKSLRCQVRYMVCNEKTCSVPGQWTLPAAILYVAAGVPPTVTTEGKRSARAAGPRRTNSGELEKTQRIEAAASEAIPKYEPPNATANSPERQNQRTTIGTKKAPLEKRLAVMRKSYLIWNRPAKDGGVVTTELAPRDILPGHDSEVRTVAFSPDGKSLASGAKNGTLSLWKITPAGAASEFTHIRGHHNAVESLAFSPNGTQLVTGGWDHYVKLWQVSIGDFSTDPVWDWQGTSEGGRPVAFSRDGKLVALGSADGFLTILNAATGREVSRNSQPGGRVNGVQLSPDGSLIALALRERTKFTRRDIAVSATTDEVHIASAPPTGEVQIWDWAKQRIRAKPAGWNGECRSVKFSPDGTLLAATGGREARLYDTVNYHQRLILESGTEMTGLDFRPDGKLLATSNQAGNVTFWDPATGTCRGFIQDAHNGTIPAIDFSPDGRVLATASEDGLVKLWEVREPTAAGPSIGR